MILYLYTFAALLFLSNTDYNRHCATSDRFRKDFIETESFGIRKRPITNRDYLIFICWNINVYGQSYPQGVINLIPGWLSNLEELKKGGYARLLGSGKPVLAEYILNPEYLDYPLTGLNPFQVTELEKWLSDRFNEYLLLKLGYLNFTPDEKDSDCFVTESYLLDQYTGSVLNGKVMHWNEGKFLPAFRLPTSAELNTLDLNIDNSDKIKAYKYSKNDFLSPWDKLYIKIKNQEIRLSVEGQLNLLLIKKNEIDLSKYIDIMEPEIYVSDCLDGFINLRFIDNISVGEKDKFGRMDFAIIGENNFDRIIVSDIVKNELQTENKIYRIAYNKRIPGKP